MVSGGIRKTPHATTISFLTWAVDLWPFINGKAISLGVNIRELDSEDALDFIHFLFEEDTTGFASKEELEARDSIRSTIYRDMYGRTYAYGQSGVQNIELPMDDLSDDYGIVPVDPFQKSYTTKPYVPSTVPDADSPLPFGRVLDAPLK